MKCCENCGSEDMMMIRQVYSKSFQLTKNSTTGGGVAFDSKFKPIIGFGSSKTEGVTQSLEGQLLSPPEKPSNFKLGCIISVIYLFALYYIIDAIADIDNDFISNVALVLFSFGVIAIAILMNRKTKKETIEYEEEMQAWNSSWVCNRCGHILILES